MRKDLIYKNIINEFVTKRERLGITYRDLSELSGVSVPTLNRMFLGETPSVQFDAIIAVAYVLKVDITAKTSVSAEKMRREQAERKAEYIMKLVKGNSALEGQGSSKSAYHEMKEKTVNELLAKKKALWAA